MCPGVFCVISSYNLRGSYKKDTRNLHKRHLKRLYYNNYNIVISVSSNNCLNYLRSHPPNPPLNLTYPPLCYVPLTTEDRTPQAILSRFPSCATTRPP